MWKRDVIEENESPWASALVPIMKKNSTLRWAVDYCKLNSVTIKDAYPLQNINENLDKLHGSNIFLTLDDVGAYQTVPVKDEARPMRAFIITFILYTFHRMHFGPTNSRQFMQMLVDNLLSPYILAHINDIIIHTQ